MIDEADLAGHLPGVEVRDADVCALWNDRSGWAHGWNRNPGFLPYACQSLASRLLVGTTPQYLLLHRRPLAWFHARAVVGHHLAGEVHQLRGRDGGRASPHQRRDLYGDKVGRRERLAHVRQPLGITLASQFAQNLVQHRLVYLFLSPLLRLHRLVRRPHCNRRTPDARSAFCQSHADLGEDTPTSRVIPHPPVLVGLPHEDDAVVPVKCQRVFSRSVIVAKGK
mmetsp:Transcript_28955/g.80964  ORF Transcript_28955/g.80964 Transcript_28955/m.80964 type:complete len:224 (-) Transcript_28955:875-1546(-)